MSSSDHNSPWNAVRGVVVFEEGQYESVIEMIIPEEPNVASPVEDVDFILDQPQGILIIYLINNNNINNIIYYN